MHELPVTQSILEIALRHATQVSSDPFRITGLHLAIGQFASIVDESIQFYWDIIAADTPADGAALHFRRIPGRMACLECTHEFTPDPGDFTCPECSSSRVKIVAGEEFYLDAIDIESVS